MSSFENAVFKGSGTAIVTPFTESGVNYPVFSELIEFQIKGGTDALVVCGTTGEPATMPDGEHLAVIEHSVKAVAGRIPVIAGTGSNDTKHAVELSKGAEERGADALLVTTPYYNKTNDSGLVAHFRAVAESVKIPVIVYNVPSRTGMCISAKVLAEISKIDNVAAIKEASGNISLVAAMAAASPLHIYSGNDDMIVPVLSLGGIGVISVLSNVVPGAVHDMVMAYLNGDTKKALELQLKYLELIDALFVQVSPIPVKTALGLMGFDVGPLRMPLASIEEKPLQVLKSAMKNTGLI